MRVCLILRRRGQDADSATPQDIAGQHWSLTVRNTADGGPWYPEVVEHVDAAGYRLFAGKLTRRKSSEPLPACFTAVSGCARDWQFPNGEPDGSWIALKFDRTADELSIACDIWLRQRWFYAPIEGAWHFSNSLMYLREVAGRAAALDRRATPYMLMFGHLPGRITPLKNVALLRPGEVISIVGGHLQRRWRTQLPVKRALTGKRLSELAPEVVAGSAAGILRHLQEAVRDELQGIDDIVLPLSGGMDSRFLLGCALDVLPRDKILTYTYGHPRTRDFKIAGGLARKLRLRHVPIAMDLRPVDEIARDGFEINEGMGFALPNSPLGADRKEVLAPGAYVLSGFIGDAVFGSHDVDDADPAHASGEYLLERALRHSAGHSAADARQLLRSEQWDELGYAADVAATAGDTFAEKFERWHYEIHCVNRLHYGLFKFRDRCFYLTPFVQKSVWDYSLSLPEALRKRERAYFAAMKLGYPELFDYPTTTNVGLNPAVESRAAIVLQKARSRSLNKIDDMVFRATGLWVYFDPAQLYGHRRELQQKRYHAPVAECIADLKQNPVLNPRALDELHDRYRKRGPVATRILRALFTIREWDRRYG